MTDCITCALAAAADRITAYRLVRLIEQGDLTMALELKGLKAKAVAARAHHERLLKAYDAFNEAAPAHAADVEGLSEEITEMSSDLAFAIGLGGNGGGSGESGKPVEKPAPAVVAEQPQAQTNAQEAAAEAPPATFPDKAV